VLAEAIVKGAGTTDFFCTAYGEHEGKFDGFRLGDGNVQFDDTLLLIEPAVAAAYAASQEKAVAPALPMPGDGEGKVCEGGPRPRLVYKPGPGTGPGPGIQPIPQAKAKHFHGSVSIPAATAKMKLLQIAEEIISLLNADPAANVSVTLEITAEFENGVPDHIKRAASENATSLGFKAKEWE
jgi:hypothetical protein